MRFDTDTRTPEATDRLMVGICGAIWLVWLVVSAVAAAALINLGRGNRAAEGSPWLLYTVIAVSALVVAGAIPLLIKARRAAAESRESAPPAHGEARAESVTVPPSIPAAPVAEAPTEKMRVFGAAVDPRGGQARAGRHAQPEDPPPPSDDITDRLFLRGTTSLLSGMGLALVAVSTATYLLASGTDIGAWVALGIAGLFTAAMPAILVLAQRELADVTGAGPSA